MMRRNPLPANGQPVSGFTMIETLIVIALIGLLVAIAIPQFFAYRAKGIDSQMKSDLKNAAVAMESYYADNQVYPTTVAALASVKFIPTAGITLTITIISSTTYILTASAPNGSQPSFTLNSATGLIY